MSEHNTTPRFKEGDKVRIIERRYGHLFEIMEVVTVTQLFFDDDGNFVNYKCDSLKELNHHGGYEYWYCADEELELYAPEKESNVKKFEVEEGFIREAYNAACKEWKEKLKEKFPEMFKSHIEEAVLSVRRGIVYDRFDVKVLSNFILIPLPNANTEWTISAFEWMKEFVEKYPHSYPIHDPESRDRELREFISSELASNNAYLVLFFRSN